MALLGSLDSLFKIFQFFIGRWSTQA